MTAVKHLAAALAAAIVILAIGAGAAVLYWMSAPIKAEPGAHDPFVDIARADHESLSPYREAYFEYEGHRLHYVEAGQETGQNAGQGDIVLFLHGFPSNWYSLVRQMDVLKDDYRVVAIDGLGAGRSDAPFEVEAYKLEAMAAHLHALIHHLGADRIHLVGHDWGAAFAFGFAQRFPQRVRTVTGLSAPPQNVLLELLATSPQERETFAYVERLKKANPLVLLATGVEQRIWENAYAPLVAAGKLSETEGRMLTKTAGQPKRLHAHINWYRANIPAPHGIEDGDYWPARDARITVPALFIWGGEDRIISSDAVAKLEAVSDDLTLRPMEGVGHWPQIERPDDVNVSLRAHLLKSE